MPSSRSISERSLRVKSVVIALEITTGRNSRLATPIRRDVIPASRSTSLTGVLTIPPDIAEDAARLLGPEGREAFEAGLSPLLLRAFEGPVVHALGAERAAHYVTVLYGLLLLRRGHELEPLHEDLHAVIRPAAQCLDSEWGPDQLAADLGQLERWACVVRRAEALKIRSYKDIRRERYRYRLTEDAVAMLEWLEVRLAGRLEGRRRDSRDLLTDVLGHLKEGKRVLDRWRGGERDADTARRAIYLLTSVDDSVHALTEELLSFRSEMLIFVSRRYDVDSLRGILGWLDHYATVYLARIEELRGEIGARLAILAQPRYRRAFVECQGALDAERTRAPAAFRGGGRLRSPDDLLDAQLPFFAEAGQLRELCDRIDGSARSVLRKMQRHLRELERRSARLEDLRAAITEVAALDEDADHPALGRLVGALVASAHGRFAARRAPGTGASAPPMPRSHHAPVDRAAARRPLRPKSRRPEEVRALRAARLHALRGWVHESVLGDAAEVHLGEVAAAGALRGPEDPRRWMDVVRARHLGGARSLGALGVAIEGRADAEVTVRVGDETEGLEVPDCVVTRSSES
ncbi:MAG: hypothetical protein DRJ42_28550 [Deltaproteobacteria bacterium]|nr:MAG: hypothetical protein DRJ42_28550 [Deltaproteobacteria bacterium]